jgi:hypothetical protein
VVYCRGMRWQNLFADLESQLEREILAEEVGIEAEEERVRLARLGLRDRLVALPGACLTLHLVDGQRLTVRPTLVGRDWLCGVVVGPVEHTCVVPFVSIDTVSVAGEQGRASVTADVSAEHPLADRMGLQVVLRDLCRRRTYVRLELRGGSVAGTIDRVGEDHCDVAVHEGGSPRRESAVQELRLVRFDALKTLRPL